MGFLLKIVEGPNKGAEIALVEGVAVTLGKGDECDVILADPTMPSAPSTITASADGVTFDGSPLAPFQVVTRGATSFAVGPSDAPWGELKWPEAEVKEEKADEGRADGGEPSHASGSASPGSPASPESPDSPADAATDEKKKGRGCLGCLVVSVVLLLVLALIAFFLKGSPKGRKVWAWTKNTVSGAWERRVVSEGDAGAAKELTIDDVVANHGLTVTNIDSRTVLVGDFATRTERLVATAEAYAAKPGVELDFCDDESLKTAAEDTLAMLSEKDLRVAAATNRVVALSGKARRIRRALEALAADMPKLRDVDVADVTLLNGTVVEDESEVGAPAPAIQRIVPKKAEPKPTLPVCGILTTPYPCLVLRSGARILEGASFGDSVVLKIEADAVTVTNATGKFVWKP
jgi:hypothetical protein